MFSSSQPCNKRNIETVSVVNAYITLWSRSIEFQDQSDAFAILVGLGVVERFPLPEDDAANKKCGIQVKFG